MTDYSAVITTLQTCLDNIKIFQQRYDDESAKAVRNQLKNQQYNEAYSAWSTRRQQRLNLLAQGRWLTNNYNGYVWQGNTAIKCNDYPRTGGGPFDLCGYFDTVTRKCTACRRAHAGSSIEKSYFMSNADGCNCASCGEQCCLDCSSGSTSDIRFNPNASAYQSEFDRLEKQDPEPTQPAYEQLIPITFNISCQACSQIIQQGAITAGSVNQGQITQTMNCVTNQIQDVQNQAINALENAKTQADAKAAADVKAAADALAAKLAAQQALQKALQTQKEAELASINAQSSTLNMLLIMFFIFIIVVILVAYSYNTTSNIETPVQTTLSI